MSNYKYKDIQEIIEQTPKELKGVDITGMDYNDRIEIGYYRPSNANWNYKVYVIKYYERLIEVATRFGSII